MEKVNKRTDASYIAQNTSDIISYNLKKLITDNGLTQKELANKIGVAPASVHDYCKGRRVPNAEFLISLKQIYGISIDDFLTKINNSDYTATASREISSDKSTTEAFQKYCGYYYVYFLDTSKYKGDDTQPPKDSLIYGVLHVYEEPGFNGINNYKCAAVLGVKKRSDAERVRSTLEKINNTSKMISYIDENYPETSYFGDFELSSEHAFINITHANTDKALIIIHRVDSNKQNYTGGIGTINSISKGRERTPVVQFIGLSRYPLYLSEEEIHHFLLLDYPVFNADYETDEIIKTFKTLYLTTEEIDPGFTEYQKSIVVRSTLERFIRKSLERNIFRYGKVSERDDDEWYHAIKAASDNTKLSDS